MLLQADAAKIPLPDKSVHCVVTSPPYWGLRKYAGEQSAGEFGDLGLEETPEEHIERMVIIFREVMRVLRDDGVVWLNYGDCYSTGGSKGAPSNQEHEEDERWSGFRDSRYINQDVRAKGDKQGSLMLMPHRLAIALQDDGWIVRNDVVWYKRNPMPESVAGWRFENGNLRKSSWRHTRAHEYVFQLVKKMGYYCNQEAVREVGTGRDWSKTGGNLMGSGVHKLGDGHKDIGDRTNRESISGRNPRSVMDVPTAPYKGAHYATFPPNLIAPLIRASCPRRACPECGQAWAAVVERSKTEPTNNMSEMRKEKLEADDDSTWVMPVRYETQTNIKDHRPTCECGHEDYKPGIVLDIFGGSGTTGAVAKDLLRDWIVMDISRPYLDEQAKIRTGTGTPAGALEDLPLFQEGQGNL